MDSQSQPSQTKQAMQYMTTAGQGHAAGQVPNHVPETPDKWRKVPNRAARRKAIRSMVKKAQKRNGKA